MSFRQDRIQESTFRLRFSNQKGPKDYKSMEHGLVSAAIGHSLCVDKILLDFKFLNLSVLARANGATSNTKKDDQDDGDENLLSTETATTCRRDGASSQAFKRSYCVNKMFGK